jgi:exopolyphosphatase / guanosine-5'-triphosphate,3'-diphosphate pyrophosphatase
MGIFTGLSQAALIDIGSYTVRLVVYDLTGERPEAIYNDKTICGLIHDLDDTGRMPDDGVALALETLERFAYVLEDMAVTTVVALATAATREAENGPAFVRDASRILGIPLRVLSGTEEAYYAGMATLASVPRSLGVCGDLGGGSLDLARLDGEKPTHQVSLPLGHLRMMDHLMHQYNDGGEDVDALIHATLSQYDWLYNQATPTFYAIGGRWRDIAKAAANDKKLAATWGLDWDKDTQWVAISSAVLRPFLDKKLLHAKSKKVRQSPLYPAAMVLQGILDILMPEDIVFLQNSLREGFLFAEGAYRH